ncbi:MAG: UDP-2,3-diacylglucosamine diphosphatase [Ignavibacteriales bacterium]|nr:UDP-2,3-diacylglucosamine diphosphatase [Ignavibacteriales bacterium]
MGKIYFISDVHLGLGTVQEERTKENRLLSFLDNLRGNAEALYIVGDLFDAWIEYRSVIPKGFHRTLAKLDELVESGIIIHFLTGNHDCWVRDYFTNSIRIQVHIDPFDIEHQGKKIFLHHGDGLAKNDLGYLILKKIIRNPLSVWFFSWLHPDIGLRLAKSSSKKSRQYTSNKHYGEGDGMAEYAAKKIAEGFNFVIMGHRHIASVQEIGNGTYINLGDWISNNRFAVMENGNITLQTWEFPKK